MLYAYRRDGAVVLFEYYRKWPMLHASVNGMPHPFAADFRITAASRYKAVAEDGVPPAAASSETS